MNKVISSLNNGEYDISYKENGEVLGSIFGYLIEEKYEGLYRLNNFLCKNSYPNIWLKEYKGRKIGILKSFYVENNYRNKGLGRKLIKEFLNIFEERNSVDCILLICDNLQQNNFNLKEWYENLGFEEIEAKNNCPLMIRKDW